MNISCTSAENCCFLEPLKWESDVDSKIDYANSKYDNFLWYYKTTIFCECSKIKE